MGKGYNNYMCKKPFHPGSKANIKRAWMAEQQTENDKRKQEELKAQYEKEQDLYNNRALISSESKDKLQLNFMYEAPPGAKREHQKEDDEPEYKFEWQRKYNAPREDYAKGNEDIKDQPFGIPVRNVRCIKCHKWGHINTDKECPLYHQASTSSMPTTSMDPMELMRQMKEDGFGLKENVLGHQLNPAAANQQFIPSDDESDPEIDFLKSLSSAEKKKLLKKLKKLSKKQGKSSNCKKKKKSKKTKKSKSRGSFSSDSEKEKKVIKKKPKNSSSSDSDSSSDESEKMQAKKSKHLESKEKHLKSESKKSKEHEHANLKESSFDAKRGSEHQYKEKYKRGMCEKDLNLDKYASKEDTVDKKVRSELREKSSDHGKHKTMTIKDRSQGKYNRETCEEDLNRGRKASKEDIAHKKVTSEPRKESSDHSKHEAKREKKVVDSRTEKKTKHYSSNSEEKKHHAAKSDNNFNLAAPKRKSETSLPEEDSNLAKKDILHKYIRSESREESSDHGKHKSKDTKHNAEDSQTERKVKNYNSNSESFPKRKPETSLCQEASNQDRHTAREDIAQKKVGNESKEDSFDQGKHRSQETKLDVREFQAERKIRTSEISLCEKASNLDGYTSKEDIVNIKVRSESREKSSDRTKHKFKETKHDVGHLQMEKEVKHLSSNSEQEKYQAIKAETIHDDIGLATPKRKHETSPSKDFPTNSNIKKSKYDHPDEFSHLHPQAHIKANYLQPSEEYEGKIHDKFRNHYREKRSPSIKQKYNK